MQWYVIQACARGYYEKFCMSRVRVIRTSQKIVNAITYVFRHSRKMTLIVKCSSQMHTLSLIWSSSQYLVDGDFDIDTYMYEEIKIAI